MSERDAERTIHRVEAFSDVVIGFSLAELGASLVMPANHAEASAIFTHPQWIFSFVFTFGIICVLWFFHHRLFEHLFTPRPLPMLLNFIWLGSVVLVVYASQLLARYWDVRGAEQMYFGLYAVAYGILAFQAFLGMRDRNSDDPTVREQGLRQMSFMSIWTAPFVVGFASATLFGAGVVMGVSTYAAFIAAAIGSALLGRRFRRRSAQLGVTR